MPCKQFYEVIASDQRLLQSIHKSEKYKWFPGKNQ
jgi:hypothetical protein